MSAIAEAPALNQALDVEDVAGLFGVDTRTVYKWAKLGELPGVIRLGRSVRFSRSVIEQLLDGKAVAPETAR